MNSQQIEVHGLIKGLKVHLATYLDIMIIMDIFVIDVPYAWGMILSQIWATYIRGSIQMELSYATIFVPDKSLIWID